MTIKQGWAALMNNTINFKTIFQKTLYYCFIIDDEKNLIPLQR